MYPSTKFYIEDRSAITSMPVTEQVNAPLFAQFFSSDKGPEEMGIYYGEDFQTIFGDPNFARHGQPLLQAQMLINNGARVLAKRIVAPDATLANMIIVANVKQVSSQKTNEDGEPLYMTPDGVEVTEPEDETTGVANTAIINNKCQISYQLNSISGNLNDIVGLKEDAKTFYKNIDGGRTFPIALVCDNGRGASSKKIRIRSNITGSRNKNYFTYVFEVRENSTVSESTVFTLDPTINSATSNLSLEAVGKTYLDQVRVYSFDDIMTDFLSTVKQYTGIEDINNVDVLFGKTKRGETLDVFEIDKNGVTLDIEVGHALTGGSNGSFGNFPLKSPDYETAMLEAFNGTFTDAIYDLDNILLDMIIDANYPDSVKAAIEKLAEFREDFVFLRDCGTGLFTAEEIIDKADLALRSRYVAVYGNSWDVIDPYSMKQITVTPGYNLAKILPNHLSEKRHSPLAGQLHGFVFDDIVEGTVNFLPKILPNKDQKEELFEKRVNFISYFNNVATMESTYTTQEEYTGFSFLNNTLAVQEVVKAIRVHCPKIRYSFMEENDLTKYEEDVQAIINKYTSHFSSIEMQYMADPTYEQNMIFYAVLYIKFKKFVQAEVFRIIAINDTDTVAAL